MRKWMVISIILIFLGNNCTCQENNKDTIANGVLIDSLFVDKSDRTMTVYSMQKKIKVYKIGLGNEPVGKKHFEGDGKTPEGLYFIDAKSAMSKYHKNLNITYPNKEDKEFAKENRKSAGGEIKIHGLPNRFNPKSYVVNDWTLGCIAVSNDEIDELFEHIKIGSPILIVP